MQLPQTLQASHIWRWKEKSTYAVKSPLSTPPLGPSSSLWLQRCQFQGGPLGMTGDGCSGRHVLDRETEAQKACGVIMDQALGIGGVVHI